MTRGSGCCWDLAIKCNISQGSCHAELSVSVTPLADMVSNLQGTHPLSSKTQGLLGGKIFPACSRSTLHSARSGRFNQAVRASSGMNNPNVNASSAPVKPDALQEEVVSALRYRLATDQTDNDKLYQSTAWSVHNRLVDTFEKTHEHWE